ncbi:MAG: hypothetical protein LBJ00_12700 [Planctomycetaceae bacterium]|nr:hypothetical protein [Planctomycetaceae bacterium]
MKWLFKGETYRPYRLRYKVLSDKQLEVGSLIFPYSKVIERNPKHCVN